MVRLGRHRDGGFDFKVEIQKVEDRSDGVDVGEVAELYDGKRQTLLGVPTVVEGAEPGSSDPWEEWLAFLGRRLIDNRADVISQAPDLAFVITDRRSDA
ncbi:hypothetical protein [Actinoplanes sp. NPDC048796]|uniref:hypothetical protein n=1 Tax=Actinoplanes sp. NPDC048796 TaxID=3155640 RepID=UPI0033CD82EF